MRSGAGNKNSQLLRLVSRCCLFCCLTFIVQAGLADALEKEPKELNREVEKIDEAERYVFRLSGLSISKQLGELKLAEIRKYSSDESNVQAFFTNPKLGLKISLSVYKSSPETKGPTLMLNVEGKEILEDSEDEKTRHNAMFKLTPPSDSYLQEYARVLRSIRASKWMINPTVKDEFRFMAVPTRKDSPIAYAARITGTVKLQQDEIPWTWATYLYSIPGYFVKIHSTYPSELWLKAGVIDVKLIKAINWDAVSPPRRQK